jgi:invasion protein IalB
MYKLPYRNIGLTLALISTPCLAAGVVPPPKAAPGAAQTAASSPAAPTPTDVHTYGDWVVRCFAAATESPCQMVQAAVKKDTQQTVLMVTIAYAPKTNVYGVQILTPLGVALPKGVTIVRDSYRSKPLPFRRCVEGCYVETRLDGAVVEALSQPGTASLAMEAAGTGKPISLPLSLTGFTDALAEMKSLAQQKTQ